MLANLDKLVVKAVGASGGYGMLVGPARQRRPSATPSPTQLKADPDNYIAQPTIQLSTAPCLVDGRIEPRHVDLRPFILSGREDRGDAGRADPRGAEARLAGGQFQPGRRLEGHLGAGRGRRRP